MPLCIHPPLIPRLSGDVTFLGTVPQHQVQSRVLCLHLGCENTPHSPPQDHSSLWQLEEPGMCAVIRLHPEQNYKWKEPCQGREETELNVLFQSSKIVLFEF